MYLIQNVLGIVWHWEIVSELLKADAALSLLITDQSERVIIGQKL